MSKAYQPLHHKYRPQSFDELVGQDAIAETLKHAITTNRIAPAYLFSGPRGTGKTSSARILARSLNCLNNQLATITPCGNCDLCKTIALGTALDVIEIDAASNTGVDNIRELIERSRFAPVQARWKVYVIDECHMLSTAAFNALLKTLEEPPEKVVFVLATTDPQRVLPTILSRCQRFDFHRIPLLDLIKHLTLIASKENIEIDSNALEIIAKHAQGGLRDAESMLDQLSLLPPPINLNSVWSLLGTIPEKELLKLIEGIIKKEPICILEICRDLLNNGKEPISILQGIGSILRDLTISNIAPNQPELCSISNDSYKELEAIARNVNIEELLRLQSQLKGSESQLRQSLQPRLWLEVLILGMLSEESSINNKSLNSGGKSIKTKEENTTNDIKNNTKKIDEVTSNNKEVSSLEINDIKKKDNEIVNDQNLEELWQKILSSLELPSTRMLLSQQAKLIHLSENSAEIEVSSNWISMIQSRKTIIEAAITKTLGSHKALILKKQIESQSNEENTVEINNSNNNKNNSSSHILKENNTDKLNSLSNNFQERIEKKGEDLKQNNKNDEPLKDARTSQVENLAEFFNGEIVDL
tara:strand:+ start:49910 stop:51673 length:1764 start_codon:yes stop_codon:yes gene_type:complete